MKPVVDRLEQETKGQLIVIRVNVQDPVGKQLAAQFNFEFTPTFIFFDSQGNELWRSIGSLDTQKVLDSLNR
jgi:thioredoxin-related protein